MGGKERKQEETRKSTTLQHQMNQRKKEMEGSQDCKQEERTNDRGKTERRQEMETAQMGEVQEAHH